MSSPDLSHILLPAPDPEFRLSDAERAGLSPLIDPSSLEVLLARVRPEHRATVLAELNELRSTGPVAFGQMTTAIPDPQFRAAVASLFRLPQRDAVRPTGQ
jgi:hypothetical protein